MAPPTGGGGAGNAPSRPPCPPLLLPVCLCPPPRPRPPYSTGAGGAYAGAAGTYAGIVGAVAAAGHPGAPIVGGTRVNNASCCCVACNATLSNRVSAVNAEMESLVAYAVALLDRCMLVMDCWMLC